MTTLQMNWSGAIKGTGTIEADKIKLPIAIPEHFGGTGEGANPKELLAASAASCYLMTLVAMLQGHKVPAKGVVITTELSGDKPTNMHIVHTVQLEFHEETQPEQKQNAQSLLEKADKSCMIGNLIKESGVKITITDRITA